MSNARQGRPVGTRPQITKNPKPPPQRVFVAGVGKVGSELLSQIATLGATGRARWELEVAGIADSKRFVLADGFRRAVWARLLRSPKQALAALSGDGWEDGGRVRSSASNGGWAPGGSHQPAPAILRDRSTMPQDRWAFGGQPTPAPGGGNELARAAAADPSEHRIFVDCTSNREVAASYRPLLDAGVAVVSANKTGFSSNGSFWDEIGPSVRSGAPIYFETTVGAGLPVLRTISDLVGTGDSIRRIEGALSGTLSYLLGQLHARRSVSQILREAHARGMTEPDPRVDLSGWDVVRKAIILGRMAGFEPDPDTEPPALFGETAADVDTDLWARVAELDEPAALRVRAVQERGRRLSYLATVTPDGLKVGLEELPPEHPCARVLPGANVISIWSDRYRETPLTIEGAGAGPDVTAQGMLVDLFRAANAGLSRST